MISALLALYLRRLRDLSYADGAEIVKALRAVPEQVKEMLKQNDKLHPSQKNMLNTRTAFFLVVS